MVEECAKFPFGGSIGSAGATIQSFSSKTMEQFDLQGKTRLVTPKPRSKSLREYRSTKKWGKLVSNHNRADDYNPSKHPFAFDLLAAHVFPLSLGVQAIDNDS